MNNISNATTRPSLANVAFRQPLLVGVIIECRDMIRMFSQLKETALAGADFKQMPGQGKDFREDELRLAANRIRNGETAPGVPTWFGGSGGSRFVICSLAVSSV